MAVHHLDYDPNELINRKFECGARSILVRGYCLAHTSTADNKLSGMANGKDRLPHSELLLFKLSNGGYVAINLRFRNDSPEPVMYINRGRSIFDVAGILKRGLGRTNSGNLPFYMVECLKSGLLQDLGLSLVDV